MADIAAAAVNSAPVMGELPKAVVAVAGIVVVRPAMVVAKADAEEVDATGLAGAAC